MSPVADGRKKEGSRLDGLGLFCLIRNLLLPLYCLTKGGVNE
jgi:hypothetical protein